MMSNPHMPQTLATQTVKQKAEALRYEYTSPATELGAVFHKWTADDPFPLMPYLYTMFATSELQRASAT